MKTTLNHKNKIAGHLVEYNDKNVFEAEIIVAVAMKNARQSIKRCLDSIFIQEEVKNLGILLLDDCSDDNWAEVLGDELKHPYLLIYRCNVGKINSIRNLQISLTKILFKKYCWLGRLDADDHLAHRRSIADTLKNGLEKNPDARWILAGNSLQKDGTILERKNFPAEDLLTEEGLLQATWGMSQGIPESELPSCNLWLHRHMNVTYPSVPSAEDHWLVAFLLAKHSCSGVLCENIIYACYTLEGNATASARKSHNYQYSRILLHNSVKYWLLSRNDMMPEEIVVGWGKEAIVYQRKNTICKQFNADVLDQEHVRWLEHHLAQPHFPTPDWNRDGNTWIAIYPVQHLKPLTQVSIAAIRNFIQYCLNHNIVCLDFARYNCALAGEEIFYFDIGRDVCPFKITYFRDMCARMYLLLVLGWSDQQLKTQTKIFQDNEEELKKIPGFEDFYRKELETWINSHGFGKNRDVYRMLLKKNYSEVTLLIKSCAMDAETLQMQLNHILRQLCTTHQYKEIILLVDSRKAGFLREHHQGDYEKVIKIGHEFLAEGKLDRLLVSPGLSNPNLVVALYDRWFSVKTDQTHIETGVPVFSQLWALEQVATPYVLQLDIDVLIGRRDWNHDYLDDMLKALQLEEVFGVGYNIPHHPNASFKAYEAPAGEYQPEVRLGLLNLNRLKAHRPFPNSLTNGYLLLTWYQSVHKFQRDKNWKSLRGGDPRSFYIHPPNKYKANISFLTKIIDLVEQNQLPTIQFENWDIQGGEEDWIYPQRNEKIIVLIMGRNCGIEKATRCLNSLFYQTFTEWGALIVDDASEPSFQNWLFFQIYPLRDKITLVQRKRRFGRTRNEWELIRKICKNNDSQIVVLDMDDCFTHNRVLEKIWLHCKSGHEIILGGMFRPDKPLKRYKIRFHDLYKPDAGNVWIHLRSFKNYLFLNIPEDDLKMEGQWIEYCDDFATMVPMVQQSKSQIMIEEYLYYHERSTPNTDRIRYHKDLEISYITRDKKKFTKRPTRYQPNIKKIEIDITYACNLKCVGCDRSCSQASENLHMSLETIQNFLTQCSQAEHRWESISVLGGEPTLHPQFLEIITLLDRWIQSNNPSAEVKVVSNGYGKKTRKLLQQIPQHWYYENSFKNSRSIAYFEPFNIAPVDIDDWEGEDFSKGCWISKYCGIGLTPQGYFPCAVAGGIERIMKLREGMQNLPQSMEPLQAMFSDYCRFCGHFFRDKYTDREHREKEISNPGVMSLSWQIAYTRWREQNIL